MQTQTMLSRSNVRPWGIITGALVAVVGAVFVSWLLWHGDASGRRSWNYEPARKEDDFSGYVDVQRSVPRWHPLSLEECSQAWHNIGYRLIDEIDVALKASDLDASLRIKLLVKKGAFYMYEGESPKAYAVLEDLRAKIESNRGLAEEWLYTLIYCQGLAAFRRGEDENCIMCRGESSCIYPIAPTAVHVNPAGSRLAVKHFTEYLEQFPEDREVQWLLHLAHLTLGDDVHRVAPAVKLNLEAFHKSEFDIGAFRDIGHLLGVNRLNCAGGGIMEDFDNDGLLDIVVTTIEPTQRMAIYRNKGDGTFEERTDEAGLAKQLGGMYCVQGDYNNDGHMDIFVLRGAWFQFPVRPSLLRNNGDGTFTDVTQKAGLLDPVNSISAAWIDYDNDGQLDLFICGDRTPNRLFRNLGNGTFRDVAAQAGLLSRSERCFASAWFDFDNDGRPDVNLNHLDGSSQFFRNNSDGTFREATTSTGITGPVRAGFSCWAWDFDNDGWLDLFSSCYLFDLERVVMGLEGAGPGSGTSKLFRNRAGQGFDDVTKAVGLDKVYSTMGSNFGDFDNDGFLDMYLGTGSPGLSLLVPNRMFKNVAGKRFADITCSSRTGHLQKGHSVACGDWDRDGNIDIFHEMGGAIPGDRYHNVLFQNPGQGNNWLTVKLVGKKSNRAAIGARLKVVTDAAEPLTIHRHVSSGSSFGANPLQQTIGLAKAARVASLEVTWPTSGTVQVFRDVVVNQALEITEFAKEYRTLNWTPVPLPK